MFFGAWLVEGAVVDLLAGFHANQAQPPGAVAIWGEDGAAEGLGLVSRERRVRRRFYDHARRSIDARPYKAAVGSHIAGSDAMSDHRPGALQTNRADRPAGTN